MKSSPEGTVEISPTCGHSAIPSGLDQHRFVPGSELPGYFHFSLRESNGNRNAKCPNFRSRLASAATKRIRQRAFTLIELILVMALLVIVLGVAIPSLKGFFRGRTLDSEAKRFLALTRYGESRAISEGLPMVLWIDARTGEYGLQAAVGYLETDTNAVQFKVDETLTIEVSEPFTNVVSRLLTQSTLGASSTLQPMDLQRNVNTISMIQFLPDGFITDTSPEGVVFREGEEFAVWIAQSRSRLNYEIQTNPPPLNWR